MIVIVESCGNNLTSVQFACARLGVEATITNDPVLIRRADRVILPGVGSFDRAMTALDNQDLIGVLRSLTQPVLGICLGMQILFEKSEEGECSGLGVLTGDLLYQPELRTARSPHMGWNRVEFGSELSDYYYFVHSYCAPISDQTLAITKHACEFSSAVCRDNFMGVQFHPERSGMAGDRLLQQFIQRGALC